MVKFSIYLPLLFFLVFTSSGALGNGDSSAKWTNYKKLYREANYSELLSILKKESESSEQQENTTKYLQMQLQMADVYRATHNYKLAKRALKRIEPIIISTDSLPNLRSFYSLKSAIFYEEKAMDSALYYAKDAALMSQRLNNPVSLGYDLILIGAVYRSISIDSSLHYLKLAHNQTKVSQDTNMIALAFVNLSISFNTVGEFDSSKTYALKALEYSIPANIKVYQVMAFNQLVNYFDNKKDYLQAYNYLVKRERVSTSYQNEKETAKIKSLTEYLEAEQQERVNKDLLERLMLEEELLERRNIQLGLTLFIFLLVVILSWGYYKSSKQQKSQVLELHKLNEENTQNIKKLKEVNEVKNSILSIIGHDLRSPFSNLISFLNVLEEVELSEEDRDEIIKSTRVAAENGMLMLDNLVYWANSNKKEFKTQPQSLNLKEVTENAISENEIRWKHKKITIDYVNLENIVVYSDLDVLKIIVRNILGNAIKFTPAEGRITLSSALIDDKVKCCVSDTGIGMSDGMLKGLFKLDESQSRLGTDGEKGTGLGLLVCREFIQLMDGAMEVSSQEGKGSTFCICLPRKQS